MSPGVDLILATATELPRPDEDDAPLRAALSAAGIAADTRAWDDPSVDWGAAQACVIRSTWNYVRHYDAFLAWAARCAAATRLWNPLEVVRWNSHKRYLVELARAGLPVVPTRVVARGEAADLAAVAGDWDPVVIKPAVSAGSFRTRRVARADFARGQAHLDSVLADRDALVQPYLGSVEDYGERALVWIDGALTHAVRKSPRFAGDPQRVSDAVAIAPDEARLAEAVLAQIQRERSARLLYARVDLARDGEGRPCLMELELVEPSLFLGRSEVAIARLVEGIRARLADGVWTRAG
jgi:glutathione synthase/RimK-type ligase-like ATP-grasp enzyme